MDGRDGRKIYIISGEKSERKATGCDSQTYARIILK
jgi:hypothetical protein